METTSVAEVIGGIVGGLIALGLFWVLPIVGGLRAARRKNRSPHWMWFGIHPIGGFIAWGVLAAAKPLKECPKCAETLKVHARVCPYCGEVLLPSGDAVAERQPV